MTTLESPDEFGDLPQLEIKFTTKEKFSPTLEQIGLYLFDLAVVFELHVAMSDGTAQGEITRYSLYRNHARVAPELQLRVQRITFASPLEVVATIAASSAAVAAAIWSAVQAIERLAMLPLNREKARAEIEKLKQEAQKVEAERLQLNQTSHALLERTMREHPVNRPEPTPEEVAKSAVRRLGNHGIQLKHIEVRMTSTDATDETSNPSFKRTPDGAA